MRPLQRLLKALRVLAAVDHAAAGSRAFAGVGGLAAPELAQPAAGSRCAGGRGAQAALVAAAATAWGVSQAVCEAPDASGDAVDAQRLAVVDLWHQLEEQRQRLEASLPSHMPLPSIPRPEVTVGPGSSVRLVFELPQQLDIPAALRTLRRLLRSPAFGSLGAAAGGSAVSESSSSGSEGRSTRIVRRSPALGALEVNVVEPHDARRFARFEFVGRACESDLQLASAVLQSAMQPRRRGPVEEFQEFGQLFEGTPLQRPFVMLDPFLGHLQEFVDEFERLRQGDLWEEEEVDGGGWERDTQPTPLRPPKRFDEWERGGGGRAPGAEGGVGEEATAAAAARQAEAAARKLQSMGAQVFMPGKKEEIEWGILAGYEQQKRQIEDAVLLPLLHPEVYSEVAKGTRQHYTSNRPRAVLFEGPPGTGKTTSARVISTQAAVPLVYIPLEAVVSKWYGESEKMLADMLKGCESFPDGCIIFLDELDSLATSRGGGDMHEATRRILGVLLRHLDGFDTSKRTVVIGATNRRQDLDPALISRFSLTVTFGLPGEGERGEILRQYARHLQQAQLLALSHASPGMAGRDLRDLCEQAERRWAAKIIRGQAPKGALPPLEEYLEAAQQRLTDLAGAR